MLSVILIVKENIEAVLVVSGFIAAVWKAYAQPAKRALERIENLLGENDGGTIFDKLSVISSIVDVIDTPSILLDDHGEVKSVNPAFTEMTTIGLHDLQHGGWRSVFDAPTRQEWDHAVEHKLVFQRMAQVRGQHYNIVAKPIFNGVKFLGWRVRLTYCEVAA
jgi:PAS domain-containing protein